MKSHISLTVTDVELSSIRIDGPITFTEVPQVFPTFADGIYKPGTPGPYFEGSDSRHYILDAETGTYVEKSLEEIFSVPYFTFRQHESEAGSYVKLEKCNSQDAEVVVPETVPSNYPDASLRGLSFSVIAGGAFAGLDHLTKVSIGDNVNHIGVDQGTGAFSGCSRLQEISVGSALDFLHYDALHGCEALTTFISTSKEEGTFDGLERFGGEGLTVRCYHTTSLNLYLHGQNRIGKKFAIEFLDDEVKHVYQSTGICMYCDADDPAYHMALFDNKSNETYIESRNNQWVSVFLNGRTLYKDGYWNTICLPFDLTISGSVLDGATARTLKEASLKDGILTLTFDEPVAKLQHGVPYIIKWPEGENIIEPTFHEVFIKSDKHQVVTDVVTFQGSYNPVFFDPQGDRTKLYLGAGNKLYYPADMMEFFALRAHFQLADGITCGDPDSPVKGFVMDFTDDASGIGEIVSGELSNIAVR